jgi:hypothetical protein
MKPSFRVGGLRRSHWGRREAPPDTLDVAISNSRIVWLATAQRSLDSRHVFSLDVLKMIFDFAGVETLRREEISDSFAIVGHVRSR